MTKFELLPHTADLRMKIWGSSLEELFQNALAGFAYIIGSSVERGQEVEPQQVIVETDSPTNLLIDFLNEVLYLSNVNKAVYEKLEIEKLIETQLQGVLKGYRVGGFAKDIKAVTYHGAKVKKKENGNLEVEIVFDI